MPSIVAGRIDGEQCTVEQRRRLRTLDEIRQERSGEMYRRKVQGWTTAELVQFYSLSRQYINRELADLPDHIKRLIEQGVQRGAKRLA